MTGSAVCDDGMCIDLRPMKAVAIDLATATVRAEAGLTWGELDAATQAHGLAVTGGRVSTTGIAGLALGSGSGWLERKLGYTCDNLIRAEVVAADGRQLVASETENPDLFWALRGGAGTSASSRRSTSNSIRSGLSCWAACFSTPVSRPTRSSGSGGTSCSTPPTRSEPAWPSLPPPISTWSPKHYGEAGNRSGRVLLGGYRRRTRGPPASARLRAACGESGSTHALRRRPAAARPQQPERHAQLLERGLPLRTTRPGRRNPGGAGNPAGLALE